jgi:glutaredoxin 2
LNLAFRLTEEFAKRPSVDSISAELEVLKAEHASLQNFLKESAEKETKAKKVLEEKHLKSTSELAEKLKTSHQRIKGLVSKAKNYETEAAAIDELIFRKDFMFSTISSLSIYPRCRS